MARPGYDTEELDRAFAQMPAMSAHPYAYGGAGHQEADSDVTMSNARTANLSDSDERKNSIFSLNPFKAKKTKEGNLPKKRGPKPDSRPAATRRQELNRQAQRTHRERKEMYTKQMEVEVVRLKEAVASMSIEMETIKQENERLKQQLQMSGVPFDTAGAHKAATLSAESLLQSPGSTVATAVDFAAHPRPTQYDIPLTSAQQSAATTPARYPTSPHAYSSRSASHEASVSPPPAMPLGFPGRVPPRKMSSTSTDHGHASPALTNTAMSPFSHHQPQQQHHQQQHPESFLGVRGTSCDNASSVPLKHTQMDVDEVGIQFVLALEQNCHAHQTLMSARTFNDEDPESLGGHALMLTCIPSEHLIKNPNVCYPSQAPHASKEGLKKLMDLSAKCPVQGGEITPALAWNYLREHRKFPLLGLAEVQAITAELKNRCRCYGWGAVVEQFEVEDVIMEFFQVKDEPFTSGQAAGFAFQ